MSKSRPDNFAQMVIVETATVYRAGGRRWFTKRAAYRALAKEAVNKRCECEPDARWGNGSLDVTPGVTCQYHQNYERFAKLVRRYAALLYHAEQNTVSS